MRLSDEQVAIQADPDRRDPLALLAREVQESRAARLRCPTCKGAKFQQCGWSDDMHGWNSDTGVEPCGLCKPCPDCIDGFLSYADSMKLLLDTLKQADCWLAVAVPDAVQARIDAVLALTQEPT